MHALFVVNLNFLFYFNFPVLFLISQSHNSLFMQGLLLKHIPFTLGCPLSFLHLWSMTVVHFCFILQVSSDLADVWKYLVTWSVVGTGRAVGVLARRCVVVSQTWTKLVSGPHIRCVTWGGRPQNCALQRWL